MKKEDGITCEGPLKTMKKKKKWRSSARRPESEWSEKTLPVA